MTHRTTLILAALLAAPAAWADDQRVKAAIGGGVGGAAGAVIGEELGDRKGAIVGAAVGGAIGAAVATSERAPDAPEVHVHATPAPAHPPGRHCPPGQAKKGRC